MIGNSDAADPKIRIELCAHVYEIVPFIKHFQGDKTHVSCLCVCEMEKVR